MIIKDLEVNKTLDREALTKVIGGAGYSLARRRKGRNPQTGKEIKARIASRSGHNLLNPSRTY